MPSRDWARTISEFVTAVGNGAGDGWRAFDPTDKLSGPTRNGLHSPISSAARSLKTFQKREIHSSGRLRPTLPKYRHFQLTTMLSDVYPSPDFPEDTAIFSSEEILQIALVFLQEHS